MGTARLTRPRHAMWTHQNTIRGVTGYCAWPRNVEDNGGQVSTPLPRRYLPLLMAKEDFLFHPKFHLRSSVRSYDWDVSKMGSFLLDTYLPCIVFARIDSDKIWIISGKYGLKVSTPHLPGFTSLHRCKEKHTLFCRLFLKEAMFTVYRYTSLSLASGLKGWFVNLLK